MLRARCGFRKKCIMAHYTKLLFLHLVGYVGHIVHSNASGSQNIDALFFMLGWDQYGYDKKHSRTHYVKLMFLYPVGSSGRVEHSIVSEP
jgi:hypothetical protein